MNRRKFFSVAGLSLVSVLADPEILLWTPGAKKIFIPAPAKQKKIIFAGISNGWITIDGIQLSSWSARTTNYGRGLSQENVQIGDFVVLDEGGIFRPVSALRENPVGVVVKVE